MFSLGRKRLNHKGRRGVGGLTHKTNPRAGPTRINAILPFLKTLGGRLAGKKKSSLKSCTKGSKIKEEMGALQPSL